MAHRSQTLGIDFGTSNSAAGYVQDGKVNLIEMAPNQMGLPTTFFFDFDTRQTLIGEPANQALLEGAEGRFMRALKRVLGTSLMHEKRQILNERITFVDIISRFLREIKTRAEAESGLMFDNVLSGRPVVFHGENDPREQQAEDDLRACYEAAGFKKIAFMAEPEAAAIAAMETQGPSETGLIVDIGGGTSDFSLFRASGSNIEILANHGVRIGGTDFDRAISIERVMPLLGKDTLIRKPMGAGLLPMPNATFVDLATWEKIPFLYNAKTRSGVDDLVRLSQEPSKTKRLAKALHDELGHDLAFAVERGKIKANGGAQDASIDLGQIETDLGATLSAEMMNDILMPYAKDLETGARETLRLANHDVQHVDRIIYVGGSSLMTIVSDTMAKLFPQANHAFSDVFSAVTVGLALAAGRE